MMYLRQYVLVNYMVNFIIFELLQELVLVVRYTHLPLRERRGKQMAINPGAVNFPLNGWVAPSTRSCIGMSPMEQFCKKIHDAPTWDEVAEQYDPNKSGYMYAIIKWTSAWPMRNPTLKPIFPTLRQKQKSKVLGCVKPAWLYFTHPSTIL